MRTCSAAVGYKRKEFPTSVSSRSELEPANLNRVSRAASDWSRDPTGYQLTAKNYPATDLIHLLAPPTFNKQIRLLNTAHRQRHVKHFLRLFQGSENLT